MKATAAAVTLTAASNNINLAWGAPPQQALAADLPALHLLNRISWGARPEDVQRINAIGIEAYLDEQLNPESLDDSALDERLEAFPLLKLSRRELYFLEDGGCGGRCGRTLIETMVLRAVYSQRQLQERMVEFWSDHFNIPADSETGEVTVFQRDVIQPNALGNFRDLLMDSARSPAMLYYLDNFLNEAEHPNENYARELMELHALGVDGGYTETDVREVARAFTGWTVHDSTDHGFYFDHSIHDTNEKSVLGHSLPAERGIEDGLHVLSILANHPSTAQFISYKLAVRFVSDEPPQSLVDGMAQVWMETTGEIRPVLRHMFLSPEFAASAGQKFRRPLDFFIGALRATGTQINDYWRMESMLQELAHMPYGWFPPDGYPDTAADWMTSSGLLARWNVANQLTHTAYSEQYSGMTTRLYEQIGQPWTVGELVDAVGAQVFGVPLPPDAAAPFIDYASEGAGTELPVTGQVIANKLASVYGLMLSSPLFQWR